ncbi:D-alanyl-D-alanine carboxypeptidase family protein [Embleya scabrispora]|uniref:D-alanyl-D-alanine carboxypeptidase family protein n=1 Tax=Embleya scabrispora TaxID=159449 RepID=UPI00037921A9|nr:D-alanyl-D-alanine carboxypeptidase [Embleya scabrispora]MYS85512.1 D-alanyl-D-alanine carboxypeptidase [Streptomyces sp. SID5474]
MTTHPALPVHRRRSSGAIALTVAALLALVAGCADDSGRSGPPSVPVTMSTLAGRLDVPVTLTPTWPEDGQAAVTVDGAREPVASGSAKPTPTASLAKVMTAYLFLKAKPLAPDLPGPTFTISAEEANRYPERLRRFESLTPVRSGEPFTERRALEALMVVSASNVAHEIARWVAGDEASFVARMNRTAKELGMRDTVYTDPSGFDRATVSTAADQVKLFTVAMREPAFASVAGARSYTDSARIAKSNSNTLLGREGVLAGKTGFTTPAGGNLVFAAERRVDGRPQLVVAAVMAQRKGNTAAAAIDASETLIRSIGTP